MKQSRPTLLCGALLASLALLTACGKNEPATPATARASADTTAAAQTPVKLPASPASTPSTMPTTASSSAMPAAATSTPAGATSSSAPASATSAPAPIAVSKVTLGSKLDAKHQISQPSDSFATDDKNLYAVVDTTGHSDGATLAARWSYLEGKGQLVSNVSQSIATQGPAITSFEVHNPDLWPAGKYQVEISLDGKPVAKKDFEITGN